MQNIGVVFVKMGQYSDAITSYEHIMLERPDYKTAFNLILCYYATGDRDKMKKTFMRLLQVDLNLDDEDKYLPHPVSFFPLPSHDMWTHKYEGFYGHSAIYAAM